MKKLKVRKPIPIYGCFVFAEFNLTSNVRLNNLNNLNNCPIKFYLDSNVHCVQGTDGYGLYGTDSVEEQMALKYLLGLKDKDFFKMVKTEKNIIDDADNYFKLKSKKFEKELAGSSIEDFIVQKTLENILSNNTFIYDMDEVYCAWQNSYDKENATTSIDLDFFIKNEDDDLYERYSESFCEYAYEPQDILKILEKCGFEVINTYDDYSDNPINDETERIVVVAKKIKTIFKDELK